MEISLAQPTDIPVLCELLALLFTQEADFAPAYDKQCLGLNRIINCPETGHILVARRNEQIIGMVNLLYTVSTALGAKVALLEDMVVKPEARGFGVGSKLLKSAIDHARSQGCKRITLLTDHDNGHAQLFYQKHGFTHSAMLAMRLGLED